MDVRFDEEKFRELVLYIATQCEEHPFFGATKLNKILFFSDFSAYEQLGAPITGAEYVALEYGPGPRRWVPIRQDMLLDGEIEIRQTGSQRRVLALRPPDLESFSPDERKIVDTVIAALEYRDAESVSTLSHRFLGWQAARAEFLASGEAARIPYETVYVSDGPLTKAEAQEGVALAEQHGWVLR